MFFYALLKRLLVFLVMVLCRRAFIILDLFLLQHPFNIWLPGRIPNFSYISTAALLPILNREFIDLLLKKSE